MAAAEEIRTAQCVGLSRPFIQVLGRMAVKPRKVVLSGQGEFLARRLMEKLRIGAELISLSAELGPAVSRCAPAHALAVLALEAAGE